MEDLLYLNSVANKIYLINRSQQFRAQKVLVQAMEKVAGNKDTKIELVLDSEVEGLIGSPMLDGIKILNRVDKSTKEIKIDGLFIAIGRKPSTELIKGIVELDESGYIITNDHMETNIAGVYAAGDIRHKQVRQIVTAAADGAIATTHANTYISKK